MKLSKKPDDIREPILGFQDVYGKEVRLKSYISNKISEIFQQWGYHQIVFPIIERASSFSEKVVGNSPWPEWDKRGMIYLKLKNYTTSYENPPVQISALMIPEGTISVSRWLGKLVSKNEISVADYPKKIYYITACFRNELLGKLSSTKGREFNQIGSEILGTHSVLSDIETLLIIYEGFRAIGIPTKDILIRLGNVKLFNAICEESGLDYNTQLVLKDKLDTIAESRAGKFPERLKPEMAVVRKILQERELDSKIIKKWEYLINTSTKIISNQLASIFGYHELTKELNEIAHIAKNLGLNCLIDPTVVRSHEYYTGIAFEVDVRCKGKTFMEVAGGGRYNKLIGKFLKKKNIQIPAVGFAYGLERIYEIYSLVVRNKRTQPIRYWLNDRNTDVVLYSKSVDKSKMFRKAADLRNRGQRVDVYVGDQERLSEIKNYALNMKARLKLV